MQAQQTAICYVHCPCQWIVRPHNLRCITDATHTNYVHSFYQWIRRPQAIRCIGAFIDTLLRCIRLPRTARPQMPLPNPKCPYQARADHPPKRHTLRAPDHSTPPDYGHKPNSEGSHPYQLVTPTCTGLNRPTLTTCATLPSRAGTPTNWFLLRASAPRHPPGLRAHPISTASPSTRSRSSNSAAYLRYSYIGFSRIFINKSRSWNGVPTRNTRVGGIHTFF